MSHAFKNYIDYKAMILAKNRRVWSAVYITIQMRIKIRRFGPDIGERLRRAAMVELTWGAAAMNKQLEGRCRRVIWDVLLTSSKNRQFLLKLKMTVRRILSLQQKARLYITQKKSYHNYVYKSIFNGLQTMRKAILFDKHLSSQYKDFTQTLISLMTHKQDFITEVARMYTQLPLFLHSVNLVRWYALYRNDGEYNKDTYF